MGAGSRKITIEFLGQDRSAGRTADQVEGRMSKMSGALKKVGVIAATGFAVAGAAAVKFGVDAIGAASDVSEADSKVGVVFGKQADQIRKAAETSATAMGLSKGAYLEANGTLGNLLVSLDVAPKKAADMSQSMVQLAGDLASFNNVSPEDALAAIKSGLTGETEPLKAFGVNMNDATLHAEALKLGLIKNIKDGLTPQSKALAAQSLIMSQTKTAQGDFARTSGGLANQQRILAAQFDNVKASVGQKLLPVAITAMHFLNNDAIPIIRNLSGWLKEHLGPAFDEIGQVVDRVTGGMDGDVSENLGAIKSTFQSIVSIITSLWNRFGGIITTFATVTMVNLWHSISGVLQIIAGIFKVFSSLLKGDWKGVWEGLKQIMGGAWTVIKAAVSQALNIIKTLFRIAWSAIKAIVAGVWDGIKGLVRAGADAIVDAIKAIPGRVKALAGVFRSAGHALITAMVDGLKNAAGVISGIAGNVWDAVKSLLNGGIDKINAALEFKISLPGPDISVNPPNIPHLARGGVVKARRGGVLALLGEAGHDEAVVPLSGPHAPRGGAGGGSTVVSSTPIILRLDSRDVWRGLLKLKRDGSIELGLA